MSWSRTSASMSSRRRGRWRRCARPLRLLARHVHAVAVERARLIAALRRRHFEVSDSQANFLWVAHPALEGDELAARLSRAGVLVAAGAALGEPQHVRISICNSAASDRLLAALDGVLPGAPPSSDAEPSSGTESTSSAQPSPRMEPSQDALSRPDAALSTGTEPTSDAGLNLNAEASSEANTDTQPGPDIESSPDAEPEPA